MVSPAARFAFNHATQIAPDHPAPPFFEGLAYVEAGDFRAAQPYWARALALSPPAISYRRDIAVRLYALNIALAQRGY
ncbi:MAG: cytochrome c-type biogenesis protein CcmH/NrfG [Sphingomonas echinoides]|jgi:cytochrome c-type biogenesis protein CcmH/NrfG